MEAVNLEDFFLPQRFIRVRFKNKHTIKSQLDISEHAKAFICLPSPSPCRLPPTLPSATATRPVEQNFGSEQKPTIRSDAGPFFPSRSTVNCGLCPAMQTHVDQSRHGLMTPLPGPLPKTNSSSNNAQWVPWSSSLFFLVRGQKS